MELWCNYIEERKCIDVIYADFSKSFDSVPHARLISKIESYGIAGKLLNWIKAFLGNRKQRVKKVKDCLSQWTDVTSAVPQGLVLGPILQMRDYASQIRTTWLELTIVGAKRPILHQI